MSKVLKLAILLTLLAAAPAWAQTVPVPAQHTTNGTLEAKHVFSGLKVISIAVTWHTQAARWLQVYDATAVPSNGALTSASPLVACQYIQGAASQADGTQTYYWGETPLWNFTGVAVVVSIDAGACSNLTADGNNNYLTAQVQ